MKKGIEIWPDYERTGRWRLNIKKARGKFTLEEIREAAMEYEQDLYAVIIKAIDEDMEQYYLDYDIGDHVTLYTAEEFLRDKEEAE